MALILAGIDEAGYGPLLGPLCVGLCVMRIEDWKKGDEAPDLWKVLANAVARDLKGAKSGKLAIADSKKLKLPNVAEAELSKRERHPVAHLERGVLAMLGGMDVEAAAIEDDEMLFARLGAVMPPHVCYGGAAVKLPHSWSIEQQRLATAMLARAMQSKRVEAVDMRARIVGETEFNDLVRDKGSKAATTMVAITEHVRRVWASKAVRSEADTVSIVCDRLGGREQYAGAIAEMLGMEKQSVGVVEETPEVSQYVVQEKDEEGTRKMYLSFIVEGEKHHMPIAVASMVAKLVRELSMARFNRYWGNIAEEIGEKKLVPTAGYTQDGRRWLNDVRGMVSKEDQRALVRIA